MSTKTDMIIKDFINNIDINIDYKITQYKCILTKSCNNYNKTINYKLIHEIPLIRNNK